MPKTISPVVPIETFGNNGLNFPKYAQTSRAVYPSYVTQSFSVGQQIQSSLTFSATSISAGLTTLTAPTAFLGQNLVLTNTDQGQVLLVPGNFTSPAGVMVGHPALALQSAPGNLIPATGILPPASTLSNLQLTGNVVVYAPSMISSAVSFLLPVTILIIGSVVNL